MNVWVRVASSIECGPDSNEKYYGSVELSPVLSLTIYYSREEAEKARSIAGGIVLEVNAASLKNADQSEFGNDVLLVSENAADAAEPSPSHAYISVSYAGLPHKKAPKHSDVAEFGPEADTWLSELASETGFDLHQ
jgi:hypothetical protein